MAGRSKSSRRTVYPDQGMVDPALWKAVESSLFIDLNDSRSRVEAYPAELLVPAADPLASSNNASGHVTARSERQSLHDAASLPEKGQDAEDFEIPEYVAIKTPKDLVNYVRKTNRFRAFYIRQRFSWSPLLITACFFEELTRLTHLSPQLKRYIVYFGGREREVEITPPALRFWPSLSAQSSDDGSHECVYAIRFVDRNGRVDSEKPSNEWSLRQSAIACRFCPSNEGASWLFITVSQRMQRHLNSYVADSQRLDDSDPFEIHILIVDAAILSWRPYLVDLSVETDYHYTQLLGTSPTNQGPVDLHESDRRQELMVLDEKLLNAALIVNATSDTVSSLLSAFDSVRRISQPAAPPQPTLVRASFCDQQRDLQLISAQVESLRTKLSCVTNLLSNFLDLSSGFALQNIARESGKENEEMRKLNERMHELAEKTTKDAAAVKVLTILTLIYLPITVVSNFFSTSFVNTATYPDGSGHIIVYSDWWIILAASIPLTLVTLYIWWVWTQIQADQTHPWWWYVLGFNFLKNSAASDRGNFRENPSRDVHSTRSDNGESMFERAAPPMTHRSSLAAY